MSSPVAPALLDPTIPDAARQRDIFVVAGTTKGLFSLRSPVGSDRFDVAGPNLSGEEIYATCIDTRGGSPRLYAGSVSNHWGPVLRSSDDLGRNWTEGQTAALSFPEGSGAALRRIWQLVPGPASEPDVLYAGVEPAALFRSEDRGRTFALVEGLWNHPHRPAWEPGGGGLCLHTVLIHPSDPDRLLVAISSAGVYRSDDGGHTWEASNSGIVVAFVPEPKVLEFGQCVHKVARDARDPERLYLQHHGGIYRSDDGGGSWAAMTSIAGMDFGFPVVAHPTRADTAYLLPLLSDEYRCTPGGRCTVWRTTDGGQTWEPLVDGLPQEHAHLTVLRDGFTTDGAPGPAGLFFGTRTGEIYASLDDGDSWQCLADHLPPVMSVRARDHRLTIVEVTVRIPDALRGLVGGRAKVAVVGGDHSPVTVGDVLDALAREQPALGRRLRDELGTPRVHVNVFVGADNIRDLDGLGTLLEPGQEISILPAISGG